MNRSIQPLRTGRLTMLLTFVLALPAYHSLSGQAAVDSPLAALEAEREAVLAASSFDEVLEYVPAEHAERAAQMTAEQKATALTRWKAGLENVRYEERRDGDRAAILVEDESRDSVSVNVMERQDGRWTMTGATQLVLGVPGARGSAVATGAGEASLESVPIQQTFINGVPVLTISNELADALAEDADGPSVMLALEECLAVGTYDLGVREAGNTRFGSSFTAAVVDGEATSFRQEPVGKLKVDRVDGDRFSGSFHLAVKGDPPSGTFRSPEERNEARETVSVTGTIDNARNPCEEQE